MQELECKTMSYYVWPKERSIPYYEYVQQINSEDFKRYFIVDLRMLDEELINNLLEKFDDFQENSFIVGEYYREPRCVLFLYFLCDEKLKFDWRTKNIKYNIHYAYKDFVTEKDLAIILKRTINRTLETRLSRMAMVNFKHQDILLNNFNLLYGGNGSGKTMFLKEIAKQANINMYSMLDTSLDFPNFLDEYRQYMQTILGNCHNKEEYFERLIRIIGNARNNNVPLLLDDVGSCGLDVLNRLKEMDILADASYDNLIVIASCKREIKNLVRARVYKPNIIEMENFEK